MLTKEAIEKRLAELSASREDLIARVNAFGGAIEDCQYWLSVLEETEDPVEGE